MKIKRLLIGMLACSAMVACTNDDEILNNQEQVNTEKANAYMSVKLNLTESTGSRATTDGGYDTGTPTEQGITPANSIFLFYDAENKYVASGDLQTPTNVGNHNSTTHEGEEYGEEYIDINDVHGDAYIAISASNDDIKKITQVLTVVNYHNVSELDKLDLNKVLAKIATEENDPSNDGFLMTTSVYYDGSVLKQTTAVDATKNIKSIQSDAMKDPVEVYIERASAKVELLWGGKAISETNNTLPVEPKKQEDKNNSNDLLVDGNLTSAEIKILGWTLNNVNENTYLVKQTLDTWAASAPFTNWNNATDHRSYWAKSTNWNMTAGNVVASNDNNGKALAVYAFEDANNTSAPMYCYEQTVATPAASRGTANPNVTTVLIAAQIQINVNNELYEGDLFKYAGVIYTEEGYKNIILQKLADANYTKKATIDGAEITTAPLEASDIVINKVQGSLAGISVVPGEGEYYVNEELDTDKASITKFISDLPYTKSENVEGFKTGYCYYQIPIEHLSSSAETPLYGVVRNHWYKLDVTAVTHIGEAVYNPEVEIPQIPPQDLAHYLAARIHVLSWHVVNQNVTLD